LAYIAVASLHGGSLAALGVAHHSGGRAPATPWRTHAASMEGKPAQIAATPAAQGPAHAWRASKRDVQGELLGMHASITPQLGFR
jgi:hypothetical protein